MSVIGIWLRGASMFITTLSISAPVLACGLAGSGVDFSYAKYADAIVIGRISNYEILSYDERFKIGRFDISVEEVIEGSAAKKLTVLWDNSTFRHPESMPSQPMLIALRDADLQVGATAASISTEPNSLAVLQQPCDPPFILPPSRQNIAQIRLTRSMISLSQLFSNFNWKIAIGSLAVFSLLAFAYFNLRLRRNQKNR